MLDVAPKSDHVIRHEQAFCTQNEFCDAVRDGHSLYSDNNHLGDQGRDS